MASSIRSFTLSFSRRCASVIRDVRVTVDSLIGGPPMGALATVDLPQSSPRPAADVKSTLDSIFDSILYAVPRHRRSVEKRLFRKHRFTNFMEHGTPKTNIIPCLECGNFKEKGHLCKHCYEKVREETNEMQARMGDDLKFHVPWAEVEFVYQDETPSADRNFVVKMSKPRPSWFPRRLLNKTGS